MKIPCLHKIVLVRLCVALSAFKLLKLMNGNSLVFRYILRSDRSDFSHDVAMVIWLLLHGRLGVGLAVPLSLKKERNLYHL